MDPCAHRAARARARHAMMTLDIRPNPAASRITEAFTATLQPFEDQYLYYWRDWGHTRQEAWCLGFNMAIEFMARAATSAQPMGEEHEQG